MVQSVSLDRRKFLTALAAGAALSSMPAFAAQKAPARSLAGVFPIAFSPDKATGGLDLEALAAQVTFLRKGGVHGVAWPQLASGYAALTEAERIAGAEAMVNASKGGNTAIVIGVQSKDGNLAEIERYSKHAVKIGADAVICIPPPNVTGKDLVAFYRKVGKMTSLPFFAQAVGDFSVDQLVEMSETIPTFKYVKDESGDPLTRVTEITKRTNGRLKSFSGNGVVTMMTEMERGFTGHCCFVSIADVYAQAYDLFHAGKRTEAFDMFGRILSGSSMFKQNGPNVLIARGVFKPGTKLRVMPPAPGAVENPDMGPTPDEIKRILDSYLKPYLRA
jgi:dihydrodipicolinate synthase/N-acetylneuraminate lyase